MYNIRKEESKMKFTCSYIICFEKKIFFEEEIRYKEETSCSFDDHFYELEKLKNNFSKLANKCFKDSITSKVENSTSNFERDKKVEVLLDKKNSLPQAQATWKQK